MKLLPSVSSSCAGLRLRIFGLSRSRFFSFCFVRGENRDCAALRSFMELPIKEEWENFVLEQLRGQLVKEFGKLKTNGERFKYCKNILR